MIWTLAGLCYFALLQIGNTAPAFHAPLILETLTLAFALLLFGKALKSTPQGKLPESLKTIALGFAVILGVSVSRGLYSILVRESPVLCGQMPGIIQRLECTFQREAAALPGARQLGYTLAASAAFSAALFSTQLASKAVRMFINGGLAIASLLALITLINYFGIVNLALPAWFFENEFGKACLFIQNPSWIWPWCTPWAACAAWYAIEQGRWNLRRILYVFSACLLVLFTLSSGQRGAVLQILLILVATAFGSLIFHRHSHAINSADRDGISKYKTFWLGLAVTALPLGLVATYFLRPEWLNFALSKVGIQTRVGSGISSLSTERLEMWKIAFEGIQSKPMLGHGFGSWNHEFGILAQAKGRPDLIFDTAHNFFVQSAFELGLLHTLLIVSFFIWLILRALKHWLRNKARSQFIWLCGAASAYILILLVQEVDFIRSAYYQHAFFWGWCLAQGVGQETRRKSAEHNATINFELFKRILNHRRTSAALKWAAAGLILATTWLSLSFSLIGYQYEANSRNGFQPRVRWLKSFGTMNTVLTTFRAPEKVFRYKIFASRASSYSILTASGWREHPIDRQNPGYIELPAQGLLSLPYVLKFNAAQNDFGRNTAVLVSWPPEIIEAGDLKRGQ
jgi:O-antigen ligase